MSRNPNTWRSNGKLLLTGEYLVMEGALSLALPINKGQSLTVTQTVNKLLRWKANKPEGLWFTTEFSLPSLEVIVTDNIDLASSLAKILLAVRRLSPDFLQDNFGLDIVTNLDFNPDYGFGTSSTLISNIANWADVDPYKLLDLTFGGSGYDIACARSSEPILFQRLTHDIYVSDAKFDPDFKENLYFVYLGKKQSSSESISNFRKNCKYSSQDIDSISEITKEIILSNNLNEFEALLMEHELIMSYILNQTTVKSLYFSDFPGAIKSLGAWGGDFVLITNPEPDSDFRKTMKDKGFGTVFRFDELVL